MSASSGSLSGAEVRDRRGTADALNPNVLDPGDGSGGQQACCLVRVVACGHSHGEPGLPASLNNSRRETSGPGQQASRVSVDTNRSM
jgi:hypothetical protein